MTDWRQTTGKKTQDKQTGLLGGGGLTGDDDTSIISEGFTGDEDSNLAADGLTGDDDTSVVSEGLTADEDTNVVDETKDVLDAGLTGDDDTNVVDATQDTIDEGLTGDEDTNILDEGLTGDEDSSILGGGLTGDEDTNILSEGLTGEEDSNVLEDGFTGDEDTSIISEGFTGDEDSNILDDGLTGDEDTSIIGGGLTGDEDTSILDGGLTGDEDTSVIGGGLTGDDGTSILDGGLTGDEDTSVISEGLTMNEDSNIIDASIGLGEDAANMVTGNGDDGGNEQWNEPEKVEQMGRCIIQKQTSNQDGERFLTISADKNGNEVMVKADGSTVSVSSLDSMTDAPFHDTLDDARSACEEADRSVAWTDAEQVEQTASGTVIKQNSQSGESRFFALSEDQNGNPIAIASDGTAVPMGEGTNFSSLPQYPDKSSALTALEDSPETPTEWSELEQVNTHNSCLIMRQDSTSGDTRFFTFATGEGGETVAVNANGEGVVIQSVNNIGDLPHYGTEQAAIDACPEPPETDNSWSGQSGTGSGPSDEGGQQQAPDPNTIPEGGGVGGGSTDGPTSGSGSLGVLEGLTGGAPLPLVAMGGAGVIGGVMLLMGRGDNPTSIDPERSRRRVNQTRRNQRQSNNGDDQQ